jgi:hypothetical protein
MNNGRGALLPIVAAVVPAATTTCAVLLFALFEVSGHTLSSPGPQRNLAEAAAMGSASEVVRFLAAGDDPNRVEPVRAYAISSSVTRVTALEAAVWYRSARLMELFDRAGKISDAHTRRHLTCLARDLHVDEIVKYLSPDQSPDCVPEQALNLVVARSREP